MSLRAKICIVFFCSAVGFEEYVSQGKDRGLPKFEVSTHACIPARSQGSLQPLLQFERVNKARLRQKQQLGDSE